MLNVKAGEVVLSYQVLGHPSRKRIIIFLHGIMGNKKNWLSFAQRWLSANEEWTALIFDLRNHGESSHHAYPLTIEACANDIQQAVKELKLCPEIIVGHSFGGKVALLVALGLPSLREVWVLDSIIGAEPFPMPLKPQSMNAFALIEILKGLPWPQSSRKNLVSELEARRVDRSLALWMTTNLVDVDGGLELNFNPDEISSMLKDFLQADLWPVIENLATRMTIHLVKAAEGGRLTRESEVLLAQYAGTNGRFHVLENAGHFLHADNPVGLSQLMKVDQ